MVHWCETEHITKSYVVSFINNIGRVFFSATTSNFFSNSSNMMSLKHLFQYITINELQWEENSEIDLL